MFTIIMFMALNIAIIKTKKKLFLIDYLIGRDLSTDIIRTFFFLNPENNILNF